MSRAMLSLLVCVIPLVGKNQIVEGGLGSPSANESKLGLVWCAKYVDVADFTIEPNRLFAVRYLFPFLCANGQGLSMGALDSWSQIGGADMPPRGKAREVKWPVESSIFDGDPGVYHNTVGDRRAGIPHEYAICDVIAFRGRLNIPAGSCDVCPKLFFGGIAGNLIGFLSGIPQFSSVVNLEPGKEGNQSPKQKLAKKDGSSTWIYEPRPSPAPWVVPAILLVGALCNVLAISHLLYAFDRCHRERGRGGWRVLLGFALLACCASPHACVSYVCLWMT